MIIGQIFFLRTCKRYFITIPFLLFPILLNASQILKDGLVYNLLTDSTAEIVGYKLQTTSVNIPDSIVVDNKVLSVVSIGKEAFLNGHIKAVKCSSNLNIISEFAFSGCKLERIELSENLTEIGNYAFMSTKLSEIKLPSSLKSIGKYAFANTNISNITIPPYVKEIKEGTFRRCRKLKSDSIELTNVKTIGALSFCETGIENIDFLTSKVVGIGSGCFMKCCFLKNVVVPHNICSVEDTIPYGLFESCPSLEKVHIRSNKLSGHRMFSSCYSLNSISLADTIKCLNYAFESCSLLKTVELPHYVESMIGSFKNCESLEYISLPSSVKEVDSCFEKCENLKRIDCTRTQYKELEDIRTEEGKVKFNILNENNHLQ